MALSGRVADAYSATGEAWEGGPARIYDRLAEELVRCSPRPPAGWHALDVGAGTGAASRALLAVGVSSVIALDSAWGMVAHGAPGRPPAVLGDATRLPFRTAAFDAAIAAFSLNHLDDPAAGLREMARVTRPGGVLLAAAYAEDDAHPVKAAVESVLAQHGWQSEPWYGELRARVTPQLATVERFEAVARAAALDAVAVSVRVPFPALGPRELVEWRLGMAQHAPFVARAGVRERERIMAEAIDRLGASPPPLVRSIVVLYGVRA